MNRALDIFLLMCKEFKPYVKDKELFQVQKYRVINSLIELDREDRIINLLKDIIQFDKKSSYSDFIPSDALSIDDIIKNVSLFVRREIEDKERELLRTWIIDTCFPKELKVLEIIKKKKVDVFLLLFHKDLSLYNYFCKKENELTLEEYEEITGYLEK